MIRALRTHPVRRTAVPAAIFAAAALLVTGCGSAGQSAAPKAEAAGAGDKPAAAAADVLSVTGTEYAFAMSKPSVPAGKTTIRFINKGLIEHDITIDALKVRIVAKPGKTAEASATLKAGTYKTYCAIPGHKESGMAGTLTVT